MWQKALVEKGWSPWHCLSPLAPALYYLHCSTLWPRRCSSRTSHCSPSIAFGEGPWGCLLGPLSPALLILQLVQGVMLCSRAALDQRSHPRSSSCQLRGRSGSNLWLLRRRNNCSSLMSSLTKTNAGAFRTVFIRPRCYVEARLFHGDLLISMTFLMGSPD